MVKELREKVRQSLSLISAENGLKEEEVVYFIRKRCWNVKEIHYIVVELVLCIVQHYSLRYV